MRRIKITGATWPAIEAQQPLGMEPEARAVFALGNAGLIRLTTAKDEVVRVVWKNRVNANNKKRKAGADATTG